ncbi:MAG: hypothetical protein AB1813_13120 [Verrucomicrobiota bacterium]
MPIPSLRNALPFLCATTLAAVIFTGCVLTSVYPFYTNQDVVFEPKLIGDWVEPKENDDATPSTWTFARGTGNDYKLAVGKPGEKTEFETHLFKLQEVLFLDLKPTKEEDDFIPPHYLMRVVSLEPLKLAVISDKWMKQHLKENPKALRHLITKVDPDNKDNYRLVLTADTFELQKFLVKHLNTEGLFENPTELTRTTGKRTSAE